MVIFGATGDLTKRKLLPALCNLAKEDLLPKQFAIVGFAVNDFTKLPLDSRRFDCACFFSVFTHTYPDETALLLAETAKSLNPNGFIIGDVFTSPLTDRCAGNRGAVEVTPPIAFTSPHIAHANILCVSCLMSNP